MQSSDWSGQHRVSSQQEARQVAHHHHPAAEGGSSPAGQPRAGSKQAPTPQLISTPSAPTNTNLSTRLLPHRPLATQARARIPPCSHPPSRVQLHATLPHGQTRRHLRRSPHPISFPPPLAGTRTRAKHSIRPPASSTLMKFPLGSCVNQPTRSRRSH